MWQHGRSEQDFDAEIESHLQLEIDRRIADGATEHEARAAARRAFGNLTKARERFYEARRWLWLDHLLRDLRYAARMLRKQPGVTAIAVITTALGIGASSAIFTVVDAVLLRPLPYPNPDRLVMAVQWHTQFGPETVTLPDYLDWRDHSTRFEGLAGAWSVNYNLTGVDAPERIPGAWVIGDVFRVLGVAARHGRTFANDAERNVVVIGHSVWQRHFASAANVIGRSITLNGRPHTVIGVMPPGLAFPTAAELWAPFVPDPSMNRGYHQLWVVGRLKRGATLAEAQTELSGIAARSEREHPATNKNWGVRVSTLHDHVVGSTRRSLLIMLGATGCLLLLACANVAGLLMSRAVSRRHEMAARVALGAGRGHIVRQLVTESLLLSLIGGAIGLVLAAWVTESLLALTTLPRAEEVSLDATAVAFTLVVSMLSGIAFGLIPALNAARCAPRGELATRSGASPSRMGPVLVAVQIAAAAVLLAGAGLLMKSFHRLHQVETGFSGDGLITVRFFVPRATYPPQRCVQLYRQMIERMTRLPGVEAAAAVSSFPYAGVDANLVFDMPGRPPAPHGSPLTADFRAATPGYFRTMGIPLVSGRTFAESDSADSQFVAVINRAAADRFFEGGNPIGQYVRLLGPKPRMIVGIVQNIRHRSLDTPPQPEIYVPHTQFPTGGMFLAVRTRYEDPLSIAGAVRAELKSLDPALPMGQFQTIEGLLDKALSSRRFSLVLLSVFGATALILAIVGTYGTLAFTVSQRTKEIGIRMAMGAAAAAVIRSTVRGGMTPVLLGLAAGIAAALSVTHVLTAMLFEVRPGDPFTMAAVAVLLLCAALAASLIPAMRAARVEPVVALRHE